MILYYVSGKEGEEALIQLMLNNISNNDKTIKQNARCI